MPKSTRRAPIAGRTFLVVSATMLAACQEPVGDNGGRPRSRVARQEVALYQQQPGPQTQPTGSRLRYERAALMFPVPKKIPPGSLTGWQVLKDPSVKWECEEPPKVPDGSGWEVWQPNPSTHPHGCPQHFWMYVDGDEDPPTVGLILATPDDNPPDAAFGRTGNFVRLGIVVDAQGRLGLDDELKKKWRLIWMRWKDSAPTGPDGADYVAIPGLLFGWLIPIEQASSTPSGGKLRVPVTVDGPQPMFWARRNP